MVEEEEEPDGTAIELVLVITALEVSGLGAVVVGDVRHVLAPATHSSSD